VIIGPKNILDMYNNFSDLQGNCRTNPKKRVGSCPARSITIAQKRHRVPTPVIFQTVGRACNRMG